MRGIGATQARSALMVAAILPLLGGCWWLESELGPGEWRVRSNTFGDHPRHTAVLFENDGYGQLIMECGQGPVAFKIASGRDGMTGDIRDLSVRYRLDGSSPVAVTAISDRAYLWFRDPATATGEDPLVRQIAASRQLTIRIDWSPADRQTMRFDTSRAGAAIEEIRRECAETGRRHGATN